MNVLLQTQAQVNAFNCTEINGDLIIAPSTNITDLSPLLSLTKITGDLEIFSNAALVNLDGLNNLTEIGKSLSIGNNPLLAEINGLENLTTLGEDLLINVNPSLQHIDGLAKLSMVGDDVDLSFNDNLTNISGLIGLTQVNGNFFIDFNANLSDCCGVSFIIEDMDISGTISLSNNAGICNSQTDLAAAICCPDFSLIAVPTVTITESLCNDGAVQDGVITAPTTACPKGSTLQYSTDGINFSSMLPNYDNSNPLTISTRCNCNEDPAVSSTLSTLTTNPTPCAPIPTLSQWGLFIFGLLLLNVGIGLIVREEDLIY